MQLLLQHACRQAQPRLHQGWGLCCDAAGLLRTSRGTHAASHGLTGRTAPGVGVQIDDDMMQELIATKKAINPTDTLLVVDAMTGQEAANLVKTFNDAVDIR